MPAVGRIDPFVLRRQQGRLIGRGAVDMKGFLAMTLAMAPEFALWPTSLQARSICLQL